MKLIKVSVIAPYEGLRETVTAIAPAYRDRLEITTLLGDLNTGADQAKIAERQGCDIIISRGGTAELIGRSVSIPVINIEISGYDYMRAIKLAENFHGRKAFVGFSYITQRARSVNELLQTDVDIFTVRRQEEITPLLKDLTRQGYELIIGDVATCREAEDLDITHLLLTSGEESVIGALENVIVWTTAYSADLERLRTLQQVLAVHPEGLAVLDGENRAVYQTVDLARYGLSPFALAELFPAGSRQEERESVLQREDGTLYLTAKRLSLEPAAGCRVFFFRWLPLEQPQQNAGITVRNFKTRPAMKEFSRQNNTFDADTLHVAQSFCVSAQPVLLTGGPGVGKAELALSIHRYSDRWMRPFVQIDCAAADPAGIFAWLDQSAQAIRGGATVCFEALDTLDQSSQQRLSEVLEAMDPKAWRFIATAQADIQRRARSGLFHEKLCRFFSQLCLCLPSLDQSHQDLQKIVNLYIIEANGRLGRQIIGVEPEALDLIRRHSWHYNFSELRQAISQMVLVAEGPCISADDAKMTLSAREAREEQEGISLTGTLEEIELRIIRQVLEQEKGNVSRTAQRLNVGRSTLWRKLRVE